MGGINDETPEVLKLRGQAVKAGVRSYPCRLVRYAKPANESIPEPKEKAIDIMFN
jgi:hypothetical protein